MPAQEQPLDLVILGAGPTGLGAAHRAEAHRGGGRNADWRLFEAGDGPGGLAASERDAAGFRWDLGGHVIYSHFADFDALLAELFAPEELRAVERSRWIWMAGRLIPFPIQRNVHLLPPDEALECLRGLLEVWRQGPRGPVRHFADFCEQAFGAGLTRLFFRPFNTKMWATDLERMAVEWTGAKSGSDHRNVPVPDLERLIEHLVRGGEDRGWSADQRFPYPARGGTGEIWRRLAARLPAERLEFGARVARIRAGARELELADGRRLRFEQLVSSLPLDQLATLVEDRPHWRQLAAGLRATQCHLVGLGIEGRPPAVLGEAGWIYFPEERFPFFRATVLSRYAPGNVPDPARHWSLLLEASASREYPLEPEGLVGRAEESLAAAGLLGLGPDGAPARVLSRWQRFLPRAYPVPTLDRERYLAPLHGALEAEGFRSRGRFGGWRYEVSNQDHAYVQGLEATDAALARTPEGVLHRSAEADGYRPARPLPK